MHGSGLGCGLTVEQRLRNRACACTSGIAQYGSAHARLHALKQPTQCRGTRCYKYSCNIMLTVRHPAISACSTTLL
jgi:hypothetical protein